MIIFEYLGNFFWGIKNQHGSNITESRRFIDPLHAISFINSYMSSFDIDVQHFVILNDAEADYALDIGNNL